MFIQGMGLAQNNTLVWGNPITSAFIIIFRLSNWSTLSVVDPVLSQNGLNCCVLIFDTTSALALLWYLKQEFDCQNCNFFALIQWDILSTGAEVFLHMCCGIFFPLNISLFFKNLNTIIPIYFKVPSLCTWRSLLHCSTSNRGEEFWFSFIFYTAGWCAYPFPSLTHCMPLNPSWVIFLMWRLINILGTDCLLFLGIFLK